MKIKWILYFLIVIEVILVILLYKKPKTIKYSNPLIVPEFIEQNKTDTILYLNDKINEWKYYRIIVKPNKTLIKSSLDNMNFYIYSTTDTIKTNKK